MNDMPPPIIVTGAARSGMPIVAGVLRACGAWDGGRNPKSGRPAKTSDAIRRSIIEPFIKGIKADVKLQAALPNVALCRRAAPTVAPQWRRSVGQALAQDGYTGGPWLYSGHDACLLWPVWHAAFPGALWVFVRRRDDGIIQACMRTTYMTGRDSAAGWQKWLDVHKSRCNEMVGAGLQVWQLWPADIMGGNLQQARDVVATAGLNWDDAAVRDFLSPIMWSTGVYEVKG